MTALRRGASAVGLGWALLSCHGAEPEQARAEAGRLVHAIESLRRAPHDQKKAPLAALERLPCTADRCDAKQKCAEAYRAHVRGVDGLAAARGALAASDAPVTTSAAELLSRAQKDLEASVTLAKECADLEGELTRRYRLD